MQPSSDIVETHAFSVGARLREVWRFREVIKNLVAQDLKVKYRRSALGFFWSLLNPLLQLTVLSLVFSLMFRIPNLSLYILSGLIPWTFFSTTVDGCSTSIVNAEGMLRRQYFPKLIFPLSLVTQNLVTCVLSLTVLLLAMGWWVGFHAVPALVILPLSFVCIVCVALGVGAVAAVVTVYFRDMQHLIGVFMSAWFYLTPIIYPLDDIVLARDTGRVAAAPAATQAAEPPTDPRFERTRSPIPHAYRGLFKINPMFAIIEMFHRPIYYGMWPTPSELGAALGISAGSLLVGVGVFWRLENSLIFAL